MLRGRRVPGVPSGVLVHRTSIPTAEAGLQVYPRLLCWGPLEGLPCPPKLIFLAVVWLPGVTGAGSNCLHGDYWCSSPLSLASGKGAGLGRPLWSPAPIPVGAWSCLW